MRDIIYYFVQKYGKRVRSGDIEVPSNNIGIDIAFGTIGYGSVIARPFRKVVHCYFRGEGRGGEGIMPLF